MERQSHYGTITEAIKNLRDRGFTIDFNLNENSLVSHTEKFAHNEFEIVDVYRYEGDSDPADESTVYAIESNSGLKGILVAGFGISTESTTNDVLKKLHSRK
jgi:hypothetical protein